VSFQANRLSSRAPALPPEVVTAFFVALLFFAESAP
jgi:hypothetical protein